MKKKYYCETCNKVINKDKRYSILINDPQGKRITSVSICRHCYLGLAGKRDRHENTLVQENMLVRIEEKIN